MNVISGSSEDLLRRAKTGDVPALSQLISALEADQAIPRAVRVEIYRSCGHAHIVGVTGAPGSGKSTLTSALVSELRVRGSTVAVVAVDPSSSLSGGAILGDRIRMQEHTLDDGVFVRSMSSRGALGGVSRATVEAVAALDASGWDVIIVETVGVGQADVEIVKLAHTTIVVSVPGLGDDIQAIKAGLLEVADIHVVNKADRADANKAIADLVAMLRLAGPRVESQWDVPVMPTAPLQHKGVRELADKIDQHLDWLRSSGEFRRRERAAAAGRIKAIAKDLLIQRISDPSRASGFDQAVSAVAERRLDPHSAASMLLDGITDHADHAT